MSKQSSLFPDDKYATFLDSLKKRIRTAQVKAALAVNQGMILLYWTIGKDILAKQEAEGWGSKVIDRLAQDLKRTFPEMKGFSSRNLKYMRGFAEAWPDEQIVQQVAAQIPVCQAWPPTWRCKSSTQPDGGEGLAKCKGNIARYCLKAACSKSVC